MLLENEGCRTAVFCCDFHCTSLRVCATYPGQHKCGKIIMESFAQARIKEEAVKVYGVMGVVSTHETFAVHALFFALVSTAGIVGFIGARANLRV